MQIILQQKQVEEALALYLRNKGLSFDGEIKVDFVQKRNEEGLTATVTLLSCEDTEPKKDKDNATEKEVIDLNKKDSESVDSSDDSGDIAGDPQPESAEEQEPVKSTAKKTKKLFSS